MAKAGKGMGHDTVRGYDHVAGPDGTFGESDLANQRQGNNQLHGEDQERVHNQRHAQAGERTDPPEEDTFIERHRTGLRSDAVSPTPAQLDKMARRP